MIRLSLPKVVCFLTNFERRSIRLCMISWIDMQSYRGLLTKLLVAGGVIVVGLAIFLAARKVFFSNSGTGSSSDITVWGFEDGGLMSDVFSKFEATSGIEVVYAQQTKEDYRERLVNSLARGVGPDVFIFHNSWVPMILAYADRIPKEVLDDSSYQNTFYPIVSSDLKTEEGFLGIPLWLDGLALYINGDIFASSGKSAPITWDELRRTAYDLTRKDVDGRIVQAGVALGVTSNVDHWQDIVSLMMLQNGASIQNPDDKLASHSLSFFTIFEKEDKVWDETLPASTLAFSKGKVAMYFAPSWRALEIRKLNPNLSFRIVPVPQLPKFSAQESDVTAASYWVWGVSQKSKNKKNAWELLRFLSEKETMVSFYQSGLIYPYSRVDAADLVADNYLSAYLEAAQFAKSSYLVSFTYDGGSGINTRFSKVYEKALELIRERGESEEVLENLATEVRGILKDWGVPGGTPLTNE